MTGELRALEMSALGRHWPARRSRGARREEESWQRHGELELLAADLRQPLYQDASLVWRCVPTALAGRLDEAERLANDSLALAEWARSPAARAHRRSAVVVRQPWWVAQ